VLGTTELLEAILCYVDSRTLLLSQRVGRKWRAVIVGSPILQKKLFMRPASYGELVDVSPDRRVWYQRKLRLHEGRTRVAKKQPYLLNPLLFHKDLSYNLRKSINGVSVQLQRHAAKGGTVKPGSWQRMYLAMPPPPHIKMFTPIKDRGGHLLQRGEPVGYELESTGDSLQQVMKYFDKVVAKDYRARARWAQAEIGIPCAEVIVPLAEGSDE
jgi:hypothetical protein